MSAEDLVLMLNTGWSLQEIAAHVGTSVKDVEQIIVGEVKLERIMERELASARS